jgi:hypothetical protein
MKTSNLTLPEAITINIKEHELKILTGSLYGTELILRYL